MRPFLTTLTLTTIAMILLWWQQRSAIAGLRSQLHAAPPPAAAPERPGNSLPKQKRHKLVEPRLRMADGSPVVTSHNLIRGTLQVTEYLRGKSWRELEALLSSDKQEFSAESAGLSFGVWSALGELDPRAALALAAKGHEEGFSIVLHDWLIRDRAAALAWFHEQPDSEAKASFLGVAGMVLAGSNPEIILHLTSSIADPDIQRKSLTLGLISQGLTDLDTVITRFPELPDSASKGEVLQSLIMFHGQEHPQELLELALPLAMESPGSQQMLGMLAGQLAAKDPHAALQWLTARPEPEFARLRGDSAGLPMAPLGQLDTATVEAAARALPAADHDWIMANHYAGIPLPDPAAVLTEVSTAIADESLRGQTVQHIIGRTIRDGTEAQLEPWLATQPEQTRAALRQQIRKIKAG